MPHDRFFAAVVAGTPGLRVHLHDAASSATALTERTIAAGDAARLELALSAGANGSPRSTEARIGGTSAPA
jgi:hypothetical protein